jgi:hypothetical protein
MVRQRNPADADEELFSESLIDTFIPCLTRRRDGGDLSGRLGLSLIDSTSPHLSERALRLLGENGVLRVAFPAHTTNNFQTLNLVFLRALKKLKSSTVSDFGDDLVNKQIIDFAQASEQTATLMTLRHGQSGFFSERPFAIGLADRLQSKVRISVNTMMLDVDSRRTSC